jgi:hypothetical protein
MKVTSSGANGNTWRRSNQANAVEIQDYNNEDAALTEVLEACAAEIKRH